MRGGIFVVILYEYKIWKIGSKVVVYMSAE